MHNNAIFILLLTLLLLFPWDGGWQKGRTNRRISLSYILVNLVMVQHVLYQGSLTWLLDPGCDISVY